MNLEEQKICYKKFIIAARVRNKFVNYLGEDTLLIIKQDVALNIEIKLQSISHNEKLFQIDTNSFYKLIYISCFQK